MSGSTSHLHQIVQVQTGRHEGSQSMPSLNGESVTLDGWLLDAWLTAQQKRRKVEEIYANGKWKEVDQYEANKVQRIIRNRILNKSNFVREKEQKLSLSFWKRRMRK